ncbi:MAG: SDR family NAD(P)-dependent oxidoreductase, partial [Arenibacterium sp.]
GGDICCCIADVRDRDASKNALEKVRVELGNPSVLINNAGIVVRKKARLEDLPAGHFEEMMAIHVNGTLNWSRLVLPFMREAEFGRIINISSVNAIAAVPYRIGYVTAKKAIRGITEALALETARAGITVNAIAPGYILTDVLKDRADARILDQQAIADRTPVGRWGAPEEIANAALYLASEGASFVTGSTLVVDGGLSIRGDAGEDLGKAPE